MLDKLPLELLDQVLDELPSSSTSKGARERTDPLLSLCLVSKRIYERALPVLWRDISRETGSSMKRLVDRLQIMPHLGRNTHSIDVEDAVRGQEAAARSFPKQFAAALPLFPARKSNCMSVDGLYGLEA